MNTVIAKIDVETPSGRKTVKELEKHKSVKLEYPSVSTEMRAKSTSLGTFLGCMVEMYNERHGTDYKVSDLYKKV